MDTQAQIASAKSRLVSALDRQSRAATPDAYCADCEAIDRALGDLERLGLDRAAMLDQAASKVHAMRGTEFA